MSFFINCPNCQMNIEILQINCRIFRCGILKDEFTQIDPHLPKDKCDTLVSNNLIFGCGKPFELINIDNEWIPFPCDYI